MKTTFYACFFIFLLGLLPRPMSPPRRSYQNQLAILASAPSPIPGPMSPRLPNPQFANTKYQRTPTSVGLVSTVGLPPGGHTGIPRPLMSVSVTPPAPGLKSTSEDYMFLKDGIHFPQLSAMSSSQNASGNVQQQHQLHQHPFPFHIGGHQQQQQQHQHAGGGASLMDMAIDLLPHDFELVPFMQVRAVLIF